MTELDGKIKLELLLSTQHAIIVLYKEVTFSNETDSQEKMLFTLDLGFFV